MSLVACIPGQAGDDVTSKDLCKNFVVDAESLSQV